LTTEELARVAGVSVRTLFAGFRDFRQKWHVYAPFRAIMASVP
jgi:hypothetical protein